MIPKIIHYIWFGDQSKKPIERINRWKEILKDWDFLEWNESNLDINKYSYVRSAYNTKRFGICIDPFRPFILYNNGGVWLDTDVEIYKDLSVFLDCSLLLGRHINLGVSLGVLGSEKNSSIMKDSINWYDNHWTKNTSNFIDPVIHGSVFSPERIFMGLMKNYKETIHLMEPEILTTRIKSNPVNNYAEHLYESSWTKK
jgi:mannosyltransferase OCH1-like enzyme